MVQGPYAGVWVEFGVVQAHRTPSNLLKLKHCKCAYAVVWEEFGVIQALVPKTNGYVLT